MRVLITGASGRIGRAIYIRLCAEHDIVGIDIAPSSTAQVVASLADHAALETALAGADAVIHTAALHAPHVAHRSDAEFQATNVAGTEKLLQLARQAGVQRFVFTSTTALYGAGADGGRAGWINEETTPRPRTIYHRTKLMAEWSLQASAGKLDMSVTALRMSRCFPEAAPLMAAFRLHRGVDARDVADAHAAALEIGQPGYRRYVISGATPFLPEDAQDLWVDAPSVLERRAPGLVAAFKARGWPLPASIDRVYDSALAARELGWRARYGFEEVVAELDRRSGEVLPAAARQ